MLKYFVDPSKRFQALLDAVSNQINSTDFSDAKIAEICGTSAEFVRRERKFLKLCPQGADFEEFEMPNKIDIPRDDLHREYIENRKTLKECAEIFGCSIGVIGERLREYDIPARGRGGDTRSKEATGDQPLVSSTETLSVESNVLETEKPNRHLERLLFLSAVKESSIQELLEEALELLFEKYGKGDLSDA